MFVVIEFFFRLDSSEREAGCQRDAGIIMYVSVKQYSTLILQTDVIMTLIVP